MGRRRLSAPADLCLRLGVHNTRGLAGSSKDCRALQFSDFWRQHDVDVMLVTETWANRTRAAEIEQQLYVHLNKKDSSQWHCEWGHTDNPKSSGVAIMIRNHLLLSGDLLIIKRYDLTHILTSHFDRDPAALADANSRILALHVRWRGHYMQLASIYMPNDTSAQRHLIQSYLGPLHAEAIKDGCIPVWGGDWNFVEEPKLDKIHLKPTTVQQHTVSHTTALPALPLPLAPPPTAADPGGQEGAVGHTAACPMTAIPPPAPPPGTQRPNVVTKELHRQCPGMLDCYRALHPEAIVHTYFKKHTHGSYVGSRIDRVYAGASMQAYVKACTVPTTATCISDHRLLTLDLLCRTPPAQGRGLKRYRTVYTKSRDLWLEVHDWLVAEADSSPPDAEGMLKWWPGFKLRFAAKVQWANTTARQRSSPTADRIKDLYRRLDLASHSISQQASPPEAELQAFADLQRQCIDAEHRQMRQSTVTVRQEWVHSHEVPSPAISAALRPPQEVRHIQALADPATGRLVTQPQAMARIMARHWAGVSDAPQTIPSSSEAVLHALRAEQRRMPTGKALEAGAPKVSEKEIREALKHMASGRSPGVDGLPVEAYRHHRDVLAALLARLFTAIGTTGQVPDAFLLGAITFIHKKGPKSDPANYRPITLLNSDYRTLTRVLASRLGPALGKAVGREQCAFLPGRRIGEAIQLLQLLPDLLRREGREAVVAFTDFSKAYDTVSRPFLFEAMEAMGAGPGLLKWAKLLLTDTQAVAVVNGYISAPAAFLAGVRQGCPLSPLLYLFIGQALLSWLRHSGFGTNVGGVRIVQGQYADDATPILESLQQVQPFHSAMQTFGEATGQRLNASKTQLLRIGQIKQAPEVPTQPYRVVQEATTLGIRFSNSAPTPAQLKEYWQPKLDNVYKCLQKLARMPLSTFGRAFGAGGYALSTLLYHAEYMGLPPPGLLKQLKARVAAIVDRKGQQLTGVTGSLLAGSPLEGGFGLLPLEQHTRARAAKWGLTLLSSPTRDWPPPPWVTVARQLITACHVAASPFCLLSQRGFKDVRAYQNDTAILALRTVQWPPTHRLFTSLNAIEHSRFFMQASPRVCARTALDIQHAPFFSNPLLCEPTQRPPIPRCPPEWRSLYVARCLDTVAHQTGVVKTVGDIVRAHRLSTQGTAAQKNDQRLHNNVDKRVAIDQAIAMIPTQWHQHCPGMAPAGPLRVRQHPQPDHDTPPAQWTAEAGILQHMVISLAPQKGATTLHGITVRQLTAMQMCEVRAQRIKRQRLYCTEACDSEAAAKVGLKALKTTYRQLWSLKWENRYKEVFWRLAVNGIAMLREGRCSDPPTCHCGRGKISRAHCFWDCPIAQAVIKEVTQGLCHHLPDGGITRAHVWLAQPPPCVNDKLWQVVALSALNAMESGRKRLLALCLPSDGRQARQRRGQQASGRHTLAGDATPTTATPAQLQMLETYVAERFWGYLRNFAALHSCGAPSQWVRQLSSGGGQPFLGARQRGADDGEAEHEGWCLTVSRPALPPRG